MIKPQVLKPGDRIAAVSLSWGGPGAVPTRYEAGKRQFEEEFGVELIATPNALRDPDWISANPAARAEDLMNAFLDPKIKGIVSTIGGDDSIRILPHLDLDVITQNPKVFLGYSDTTVTDPIFVIPYGISAVIDCDRRVFSIDESACTA
jgi:muramoyltetrapeptide carboxypeptidase LdcA involved in peptidoglycan recycling